jgi:hypothetical protein
MLSPATAIHDLLNPRTDPRERDNLNRIADDVRKFEVRLGA